MPKRAILGPSKSAISRERWALRGRAGARSSGLEQGCTGVASERPRAAYLRRYEQRTAQACVGEWTGRGALRSSKGRACGLLAGKEALKRLGAEYGRAGAAGGASAGAVVGRWHGEVGAAWTG